jgi:hypothetical protein
MWQEWFAYGTLNTLAAGAGNIYVPNNPPLRIDSNSDFLWMKNLYGATNAQIRVTFQDNRLNRQLTTTNVALNTVASNFAGSPFIIPPPYYLLTAGSMFALNAADNSGIANVLRFVMHGAKLRAGIAPWEQSQGVWRTYRRREPFIYNSGVLAIGAGQTLSWSAAIENDAPFLVQKMTGQHNGAVGALLVDLRDTTSSENNWMNTPVPFETIFGTGQLPNIMYAYRLVGGNNQVAVVTMNIQNTTAFAINLEVSFCGLKLFA